MLEYECQAVLSFLESFLQEVLWDDPPIPESDATCALFYSISSTQVTGMQYIITSLNMIMNLEKLYSSKFELPTDRAKYIWLQFELPSTSYV